MYNTNMEQKKAKAQLEKFLNGKILTFSITHHENSEWVAQCNEIPGIITGGVDLNLIDAMLRDAILTAANVDVKYANTLLRNVGYTASTRTRITQTKSKGTHQLVCC